MDFEGLDILDNNGNTRFVKTIAEVRQLVNVGTDITFTVPKNLENKIWAVAEIIHGTTDFIEEIIHFNNLNPHILLAGTILKIPNLSSYHSAINTEDVKPSNQTTSKVTAKKKNQSISIKDKGRMVFSSNQTK